MINHHPIGRGNSEGKPSKIASEAFPSSSRPLWVRGTTSRLTESDFPLGLFHLNNRKRQLEKNGLNPYPWQFMLWGNSANPQTDWLYYTVWFRYWQPFFCPVTMSLPTCLFWDPGGVKLEPLCNSSIVGCQWTVNCLLGAISFHNILIDLQYNFQNLNDKKFSQMVLSTSNEY